MQKYIGIFIKWFLILFFAFSCVLAGMGASHANSSTQANYFNIIGYFFVGIAILIGVLMAFNSYTKDHPKKDKVVKRVTVVESTGSAIRDFLKRNSTVSSSPSASTDPTTGPDPTFGVSSGTTATTIVDPNTGVEPSDPASNPNPKVGPNASPPSVVTAKENGNGEVKVTNKWSFFTWIVVMGFSLCITCSCLFIIWLQMRNH